MQLKTNYNDGRFNLLILAGIDGLDLRPAVGVAVEMVKNGDNGIHVPAYTYVSVDSMIVKLI